jgi:fucokinase
MVAKDRCAALRIRELLTAHPLAPNARFVDMKISRTGLQVSRS